MRVLLITQYYAPEPHDQFTDLAESLAARGHTVQVLTGFPCYPVGAVYEGWRQRLWHEETVNGVRVTRVPQIADHSRSAIRRVLYYLSFAVSASLIGLFRARRCDAVMVYQAAMPVGFVGWLLSRVKRAPLVLNVVDLWPESVEATGMVRSRRLLGWIEFWIKRIYHAADHICVITEGYRERLAALGVPRSKLSVVHMWGRDAPPARSQTEPPRRADDAFTCVYAGAMGPCQDLGTVLAAFDRLRESSNLQLTLVGDGVQSESLRARAAELGLRNVTFTGRVPRSEANAWMQSADALLLHLKPDVMSVVSIPSKTIDYLAHGKPIVAAIDGETAQLIESAGCGVTAPAGRPQELAEAIARLANDPAAAKRRGEAARRAYDTRFDRERQVDRFEAVLARVTQPIGGATRSPSRVAA